jgi:hypothetical protein
MTICLSGNGQYPLAWPGAMRLALDDEPAGMLRRSPPVLNLCGNEICL